MVFSIPREEAYKKSVLLSHSSQGLNVNETNVYYVIDWLRQIEQQALLVSIHKGIGFDMMETKKGIFVPVFKGYKGFGGLNSEYRGDLPIKPKSKLENFQAFCKEHINHTPLALAVALVFHPTNIQSD